MSMMRLWILFKCSVLAGFSDPAQGEEGLDSLLPVEFGIQVSQLASINPQGLRFSLLLVRMGQESGVPAPH